MQVIRQFINLATESNTSSNDRRDHAPRIPEMETTPLDVLLDSIALR